jgi:hypothetical protein
MLENDLQTLRPTAQSKMMISIQFPGKRGETQRGWRTGADINNKRAPACDESKRVSSPV